MRPLVITIFTDTRLAQENGNWKRQRHNKAPIILGTRFRGILLFESQNPSYLIREEVKNKLSAWPPTDSYLWPIICHYYFPSMVSIFCEAACVSSYLYEQSQIYGLDWFQNSGNCECDMSCSSASQFLSASTRKSRQTNRKVNGFINHDSSFSSSSSAPFFLSLWAATTCVRKKEYLS